jgi:hypothetical protein
MRREVMLLRTLFASPKLEKAKMKEYLIRLMYVEMLGHDASFGYIHAVKATHESDLSMAGLDATCHRVILCVKIRFSRLRTWSMKTKSDTNPGVNNPL